MRKVCFRLRIIFVSNKSKINFSTFPPFPPPSQRKIPVGSLKGTFLLTQRSKKLFSETVHTDSVPFLQKQ